MRARTDPGIRIGLPLRTNLSVERVEVPDSKKLAITTDRTRSADIAKGRKGIAARVLFWAMLSTCLGKGQGDGSPPNGPGAVQCSRSGAAGGYCLDGRPKGRGRTHDFTRKNLKPGFIGKPGLAAGHRSCSDGAAVGGACGQASSLPASTRPKHTHSGYGRSHRFCCRRRGRGGYR